MPVAGIVPDWLFSIVAVATVFTVMFDIGLAIVPGDFRSVGSHPGLMLKGLFSVLVAVPALAWFVARMLDLPRPAEVGIMLMAISPVPLSRCAGRWVPAPIGRLHRRCRSPWPRSQ
jgi:predicted Na+-dependent transporter